ncbi:glycoside hydrolase domain-containing protein [Bacteroides sp. 519]|uniref:glycoside hydrolase domain-containing protein n=1 Tax=Bacteroides sp. 519 TaxID=2302937 RepID=UPI0013D7F9E4|nr:glycoside hydrolase domain-containing protein [Bacteroides sp. 519]NDV56616.1 DUF4975 domain-containing protein [Bacteroides sp. 519]
MKNIKPTLALCMLVALTACSKDEINPQTGREEIRPTGTIKNITVGTRGDGMQGNTLKSDLNVNFIRLDASPAYPANYLGCTTLDAKIASFDNALTFSPSQYYQESGETTKLLGWYPTSGTLNTTDGKVIFPSIDGSTDIMITTLKEGSSTAKIPTVAFSHVLTQISIKAYAVTPSAKDVWGGIESIVIKNKKQTCELNLPATDATAETGMTVSFGTPVADLELTPASPANNIIINGKDATSVYKKGNALPLGDLDNAVLCGYSMFAPNAAGNELVIEIITEKGGTQIGKLTQALDASTSYELTLAFTDDQISPTASVTEWQSGGSLGEIGITQPDQLAQALAYKEVNDLNQTYSFFHKPHAGWVGDPMPFYEDGKYYVFYLQDARDGAPTFHPWYEATTTDFVTYQDNGLMIACGTSSSPEKALGTGSVYKKDGVYYAFYTAHNGDDGNYPRERILMATSTNLKDWNKVPESDFCIKALTGYAAEDFRDPIIFFDTQSNTYKMLISTRSDHFSSSWTSVLAQYSSTDLRNWTLETPFYNGENTFMVECPDVFIMGSYQYLIYSDIDDRKVHYKYRPVNTANWTVPANSSLDGVAFYAGKTTGSDTERYIFGWCPTRTDANDYSDYSWAGSLVVHQLLQQTNGELKVGIPTTVNQTINNKQALTPLVLKSATHTDSDYTLTATSDKALAVFPRLKGVNKISATITPATAKRFGIEFAAFDKQEYVYDLTLAPEDGVLRLDQKINQSIQKTITSVPLPAAINGKYEVTVMVENSVCVVYVNNEVALTNRIYQMAENPWGIFAEEGAADFTVGLYR